MTIRETGYSKAEKIGWGCDVRCDATMIIHDDGKVANLFQLKRYNSKKISDSRIS